MMTKMHSFFDPVRKGHKRQSEEREDKAYPKMSVREDCDRDSVVTMCK